MTFFVGVVSQKGGVGKSTVCRLLATVYAQNGWHVKIADFDIKQGTCTEWRRRRDENSVEPTVPVEGFRRVADAKRISDDYHMIVFDGAPHSSQQTAEIAKLSDLIILPTGDCIDDRRPTILLAHELRKLGVPEERIRVALIKVSGSKSLEAETRIYFEQAGYTVLEGSIPNKPGYVRTHETGRSLVESSYASLRGTAEHFATSVVTEINTLMEKQNGR